MSGATDMAMKCSALGDPIRWRITQLLARGERCVCDLGADLDVAQSRLSYHLSVLRDAGLISQRKDGRWMYYALNPAAVEEMASAFAELAATWAARGKTRAVERCYPIAHATANR
jgi:ArsR family transcriptional regulator, arsenate/arsenite/antimonite-responsive transcriptional repressor